MALVRRQKQGAPPTAGKTASMSELEVMTPPPSLAAGEGTKGKEHDSAVIEKFRLEAPANRLKERTHSSQLDEFVKVSAHCLVDRRGR